MLFCCARLSKNFRDYGKLSFGYHSFITDWLFYLSLMLVQGLALSVNHNVGLSSIPMESTQSSDEAATRRCVKQLQQHAWIAGRMSWSTLHWTSVLRRARTSRLRHEEPRQFVCFYNEWPVCQRFMELAT